MGGNFLERFRAEAADVLTSIFLHSCDCIKLMTLDGKLEYVSDSARGALGLATTADAVGRNWPAMWPEEQRPALQEALASAARGESAQFQGTTGEGAAQQHWDVAISPVRGADGIVTRLIAISTEVTAHVEAARLERARAEQAEQEIRYAATVARELRHRLKNQLAVVGAVAKLLARHTVGARELAQKLEDKLIALSRAQDLLTVDRDNPISAREAVTEVVSASGAGDRVAIGALPDLSLPDESVQQIALILGELHTNALKHGALRDDRGRVELTGLANDGLLTLRWREDCGGPVAPVVEGNGGFQLIKRLGMSGRSQPSIGWHDTGIDVEFHVRASG